MSICDAWQVTYRGWLLEHMPQRPGIQDCWVGTSPDFQCNETGEEIEGSFAVASNRMELLEMIDRNMK